MARVFAPASLEAAIADGRWRLPVVRAEADFRAPMRLGDRLVVRPRLHRLGARSLAVDYTIVGEVDGVVRAEVRLTHAALSNGGDGDGGQASGAADIAETLKPRSVALPDSLRARLQEVLGEAS